MKNSKTKIIKQQTELYSGPIPSPEILIKFEDAIPGAANRIITMAEKEQTHRHYRENKEILIPLITERLGMIFAFLIVLAIFGCGTWLIFIDRQVSGTILSGTSIITIVGYFIQGKKKSIKN